MEKVTLVKSEKLVDGWRGKEDEATKWGLKVFQHLMSLEVKGIWQKESYYSNLSDKDKYSKLPFGQFIKDKFKITNTEFQNVKRLLSLPEGENIYLRYGGSRDNIVTYLNSDVRQRPKLIKEAENRVVPQPLRYVKKELEEGLNLHDSKKKKIKVGKIDDAKVNHWKKKFEKLQKEFEEYKVLAEKKFGEYQATIKVMMGINKEDEPSVKGIIAK